MDLDPELAEKLYPIRVLRRELIQDSGGPGQYRGGLGMREGFHFLQDVDVSHTTSRTKDGPLGMSGGKNGRPGRSIKDYGESNEEVIGGLAADGSWKMCMLNYKFNAGESLTLETQGGGGWGNPQNRDKNAVLEDVADGYVSSDMAKDVYGLEDAE
jgi:N-methylhydantoinase B